MAGFLCLRGTNAAGLCPGVRTRRVPMVPRPTSDFSGVPMFAAIIGPFPCFHAYFWLRPLTVDGDGSVSWECRFCGHITKRAMGVVPIWGTA